MTDKENKDKDKDNKDKEQNTVSRKPRRSPRRLKRGAIIKRIIIIVVVLGLLGGGYWWWRGRDSAPALAQDDLTEFTVQRGTVTHTVSGPGTVSPVKIFTIATNLTGDILEDYFEEGEEVEKDALLFQLDGETTSINFDAAKDTLSNAQDSYQSALRNQADLVTTAKQAGLISALYVKKGDSINNGGRIADIIDTGSMLLTLPFNSTDAAKIRAGEAAAVFLDDYDLELSGNVRKVMSGQAVSAAGALVTNVEIVFANPGALSPGALATAVVGEYACNDEGKIEYAAQDTVYAAGSGKIIDLPVNVGDHVRAGQRIVALENSSVGEALTRAAKSVEDAEKKLTNTQNNLQITSPIAGTVLAKSAKAGDTLYNTSTTLAIVADMSCLVFTIDVDELEIRYVQAGQQATVTADAYEGETFAGIVTNVGKTGTASSGVTTYPVTIEIAEYGGLLPGMNVNADIVVRQAVDALYVPVDAVTRGNMVLVKSDAGGQMTGAGAEGQWPGRGDGQGQWPARGEGQGEGQGQGQWPARGEGQGQGQWPGRGEGQGQGQGQWPARGEGQGQGQGQGQWPARGEGQTFGSGGPNMGFMGAQPPEGYVYRRVQTGISDSNYVEIISGLNEGDIVAYRPAVRDSGNMNFNMFMGPGGGTMMFDARPAGGGGNVMRQGVGMPGGR